MFPRQCLKIECFKHCLFMLRQCLKQLFLGYVETVFKALYLFLYVETVFKAPCLFLGYVETEKDFSRVL